MLQFTPNRQVEFYRARGAFEWWRLKRQVEVFDLAALTSGTAEESSDDVDPAAPIDVWRGDERVGYAELAQDNPLRLMRGFATAFATQRGGDHRDAIAAAEAALVEGRRRWGEGNAGLVLGYATLTLAHQALRQRREAAAAATLGLAAISAHPERAVQLSPFRVVFLLAKAEAVEADARPRGEEADPGRDRLVAEARRYREEAARIRRAGALAPATPFFNLLSVIPGLQPISEWSEQQEGETPSPLTSVAAVGSTVAAMLPSSRPMRGTDRRLGNAAAVAREGISCLDAAQGAAEAGDFEAAARGMSAALGLVTESNMVLVGQALALPREHERRAGLEKILADLPWDAGEDLNPPGMELAVTAYAQGRMPELAERIERTLTPRLLLQVFQGAIKDSEPKRRRQATALVRSHGRAVGKAVVYLRTALVLFLRPAEAKDLRTMAEASRWLAGPGGRELRALIAKATAPEEGEPRSRFLDSKLAGHLFRWTPAVFDSLGWAAARSTGDVRSERAFSASIFKVYRGHLQAERPRALAAVDRELRMLETGAGSAGDRSLRALPPVLKAAFQKTQAAGNQEDDGRYARLAEVKMHAAAGYFLIPLAARDSRWADIVTIGDPAVRWLTAYLDDEYGSRALTDLGEAAGGGPIIDIGSKPWAYYLYALHRQGRGPEAIRLLDRGLPAVRAIENGEVPAEDGETAMTRPDLAALLPDTLLQAGIVLYAAQGRWDDAVLLARIRARKTQLNIGVTMPLQPPDQLVGLRVDGTRQIDRPPFEQLMELAASQPDSRSKWSDVLMAMDASKQTPAGDAILLRAMAEAASQRVGPKPMEAYESYMWTAANRSRNKQPLKLLTSDRSPEQQARLAVKARAALIAQLKSALPEVTASLPGEIDMVALRNVLRPGELVVTTMVVGNRIGILTVSPDAPPKLGWSPALYSDVAKSIANLERRFALPADGYDPADLPEPDPAELEALYAALVGPVEQEVLRAQHIIWSPDLRLAAVPVVALRARAPIAVPGEAPTAYLGLARPISFSPRLSGFVLRRQLEATAPAGRSLAIGDIPFRGESRAIAAADDLTALLDKRRMPGAKGTIEKFVSLTGGEALTGTGANLGALEQLGARPIDLLMLYTHGLGNPAVLGPALILSPAPNAPDPRLRQADILALRIRPRLVLLAACSTGAAGDNGIEPYGGVVQGFLAVGAQAVLSAQSRVDEAAVARLIEDITRGLAADRLPPGEALRKAQRRLEGEPGFDNPIFWAQLVWVGDGARR
ncbi:MAG: CHAT domain-containing protein [Allosphingosinicella sp.]